MPLTQIDIGDILGLTAVHTNRVVRRLREERLIELARGRMTVVDGTGLRRAAGFDMAYLHEEPRRAS